MGDQRVTPTKSSDRSLIAAIAPHTACSGQPTTHPLFKLQRQIGNRAVTQRLQAKMTIGKPNNIYEQEADRVADTVMRMPDPPIQHQLKEKKDEHAQALALQRQPEEKKDEHAQTKLAIGAITPLVQQAPEEEKQAKTLQLAPEEKKDEHAQTLQLAPEEKKDEHAQTLQLAPEEKKDEHAQTLQLASEEKDEHAQAVQLASEEEAQAKGMADSTPEVSPNVEGQIQAMRGGGQPLPDDTRDFYESRFGYDFSGVRVHTDTQSGEAASSLNAQAFAIGQDIFFGSGRYEPQTHSGKWLLAHELTHTVQQQPKPLTPSPPTATSPTTPVAHRRIQPQAEVTLSPAQASFQTVQPSLRVSAAAPQIQRFGFDDILNWVADKAANIPGFTLLTFILGRNPISNKPVERNATNLVRGLLGLVIGGDLIFKTLQESGALDRTFGWLNAQLQQLNITWDGIKALFKQAWDAVSITDGVEGAYEKIKGIFSPTIQRITSFASSIVGKVIEFIKDAILKPVGQFVKDKVPGYKLLTVILGKDPVSGEAVERNANNLIEGILDLVPGGKETFKNLKESGAIERAFAWLDAQIKTLNFTWEIIKGFFKQLWDTLSINDITSPQKAFEKVQTIFGPPIKRIGDFALAVGKKVLEFVLEGVMKLAGPFAGTIVGVFKSAGDTFSKIINNPIGFASNLIKAVKQGFLQFSDNILTHLKTGLMSWLFGAIASAGITLPQKFDLEGIVSLVLQVLGVTYTRLRGKLVDLVGEKAVSTIEKTFDFLVTIVTKGLAAAWEKLVEFVGNLGDMVIGAIKDWVVSKIVTAAVTKLISLFNPAGAVIQAILAVYNTVAFFMERAQQIAMLVTAVTKSISSIASGAIGAAANFVEQSMAKAIPVILGFLARFIGLGNVAEPIQKTIQGIQDKVWGAITKLANFIVGKAKSLLGKDKKDESSDSSEKDDNAAFSIHTDFTVGEESHEIANKSGSPELTLSSSNPTLLSNHPNEDVRKAYAKYLQDIAAAKSPSARKQVANQNLSIIVKLIKGAGSADAPGASAPGISTVDFHKNQQSRLQKSKISVWELESEHVIPRAYVDAAFTALAQAGAPAGKADYNNMHTILIYKVAADLKTEGSSGDASKINDFKITINKIGIAMLETHRLDRPRAREEMTSAVIRLLSAFALDARQRTNNAIKTENLKNGASRGPAGSPEPPTPNASLVGNAYEAQRGDINNQLMERINAFIASRQAE